MNTTTCIDICITDDHKIFRNGLISSLEPYPEINIIGQAETAEELLNLLDKVTPQVVLIDMKMPGMDGIEATDIIKKKFPDIKVIGLSVYENHHYVINMFKAGANGYLLKDTSPDEIVSAIKTVVDCDYYFNQMVSSRLLRNLLDISNPRNYTEEMTEIETEILKLICKEYTNSEIAEKVNLGPKTVENYRNRILSKTKAKNTAGLVIYAIRKGYIVV